jgi:hypothetical protein
MKVRCPDAISRTALNRLLPVRWSSDAKNAVRGSSSPLPRGQPPSIHQEPLTQPPKSKAELIPIRMLHPGKRGQDAEVQKEAQLSKSWR